MADQPLLEVNCANCPGTQACEDCLVRFFLIERDTAVVPLARRRSASATPAATFNVNVESAGVPAGLPADIAAALASLEGAGLAPELLSLESDGAARAS